MNLHALSGEQALKEAKSTKQGLSQQEIEQRRKEHGSNELEADHAIHPFIIFIRQFKDFLIILLLVATVLSIILGDYVEAIAMFAIVLLAALLGFFQEYKAEKAVAALQKIAAPHARVIREGREQKILAKDIVPGDIILLEEGDIVPADARLLEVHRLEANEASLTGESVPAAKIEKELPEKTPIADQDNMVFFGTNISYGRAIAVVAKTGMNTELGKIASSLQHTKKTRTPLQIKFGKMAQRIGYAVLALVVIVFIAGIFQGLGVASMLIFALSLAVAAVPSSLPAIVTIGLSLGAKALASKNMIIKSLPATEALGSATIICSDKTGTLTKNEMTVTKIFANNTVIEVTGSGYSPEGTFENNGKKIDPAALTKLLEIGVLCNNATYEKNKGEWELLGDPTEGSLLVLGKKAKFTKEALLLENPVIDELPFDSDRKRMSVIVDVEKKQKQAYVKGAPDLLLEKCSYVLINNTKRRLTKELREEILGKNKTFAQDALRVLGIAYKDVKKETYTVEEVEKNLVFVGLVGMIDPPREGVKEAITACGEAGIEVMIITGDHALTTEAIAKSIGIFKEGDLVLTGEQVEQLTERQLEKMIGKVRIIARALPIQKQRIVVALKKKGHVVAMTGDGVNDAPALKKADIGIAMGMKGTDVAKEVSQGILVDDHFATIVNAIAEGRNIYDKILKAIRYLLSCNMGEIIAVFLAIIFRLPLPLLPLQLLLMNLLTDGLPALALSTEPLEKETMQRPPRNPNEQPLSKHTLWLVVSFGIIMGLLTLGTFVLFQGPSAQTMAFTVLVVLEMMAVIAARSKTPLRGLRLFSNMWLVVAIASSLIIQLAVLYIPFLQVVFGTVGLSLIEWASIIGIAIFGYFLMEGSKAFFPKSL